jgi:predicted aldo/keto reductase-like oxidoreductase
MDEKKIINRRTFTKRAAGSLIASGLLSTKLFSLNSLLHAQENSKGSAAIEVEYRTLGRTGMKYTTLGFGAMRTSDPAVIRKAIDLGVNNIDTARVYMGGSNEEYVGKAIGDIRQKVHITSKVPPSDKERMLGEVEKSLKAIGTDYLDILLLHGLRNTEDLEREEWLAFLQQVKKDGKVRFVGFSTHSNMSELITAALKDKFFDVILTAYNFKAHDGLISAIKEAAKAGIGIIAMKTQAGGYEDEKNKNISPHQAALKWVLANEGVTCTIPSMVTFEQVDENIQVMGSKMGWQDRKILYHYGKAIDRILCRFCEGCRGTCPHGVSISDVNRCIMYHDVYKDSQLALLNYADIQPSRNISSCTRCTKCSAECRYGLNIPANMSRAVELFV